MPNSLKRQESGFETFLLYFDESDNEEMLVQNLQIIQQRENEQEDKGTEVKKKFCY